jgi:hypothetical protein
MGQRISRVARSAAMTGACIICIWSPPNSATAQTEEEGQFIDQTGILAATPRSRAA